MIVIQTETAKVTTGSVLIRLQGIKKVFFTDEVETHALAEVDMEIKQGEYVAISGPSGCGKTTPHSILGLFDTASEGEHMLDGRPVAGLDAADRARVRNRQIGLIFQAFNGQRHAREVAPLFCTAKQPWIRERFTARHEVVHEA